MTYYFKKSEFNRDSRNWYDDCSPRLLVLLDAFRLMWGKPVRISQHPRAIGRTDGDSFHNIEQHGQVKAIDVIPSGMNSDNCQLAIEIAMMLGLTGIGYYPDWNPSPGLHLDVRPGDPKKPATWGGVRRNGKQVYVSLEDAMIPAETGNSFGI